MNRNFWKLTRWARALRFWLFLLVAALAWLGFGVGEAKAQPVGQCGVGATGCTRAEALAQCEAMGSWRVANFNRSSAFDSVDTPRCNTNAQNNAASGVYSCVVRVLNSSGTVNLANANCAHNSFGVQHPVFTSSVFTWSSGCPAGQEWFSGTFNRCDTTCESRPAATTLFRPKNGSEQCQRGCMRSFMDNGDEETMTTQSTGGRCEGRSNDCALIPSEKGNFVWNPYLGACEPVSPQCPEGMKLAAGKCVREDFCPIGQILNENNTCEQRDGECPAGSTRSLEGMCVNEEDDGEGGNSPCPEGKARGNDGTCKPDLDGDGIADGDDDNFSGGDDCSVPPTCSGDTIMCGQARIQWRIDCNTRRNQKISGGGCSPNTMPICVGESCDLMQYGQLVQQWGARCAMEKLADGLLTEGDGPGGPGEGDGRDPDFDPYAAGEGDAEGISDGGVDADDAFTDETANNDGAGGTPGGTGELDTSGLGFTRGCAALPVIQVMGATLDFGGPGNHLCDWMRLGGTFVLIIAALISARIIGGGSTI